MAVLSIVTNRVAPRFYMFSCQLSLLSNKVITGRLISIKFSKKITMNCIKDVKIVPLHESKYVIPLRMEFIENERNRIWDLIQFRPGVYLSKISEKDRKEINTLKYPRETGLVLEWCSGIVDKDKSLEEIACDEILEECGYLVKPEHLERVKAFRCSVGIAGDEMTMFYAEVTDDMKISHGGGLPEEGEFIEVIELGIPEALALIKTPKVSSPADFLFGLMWFYVNKLQVPSS